MIIVLDSSAWFAYFDGSPEGEVVRDYIDRATQVITPASVVAQIVEAARSREDNPTEFLLFLEARSRIQPLTADIALRAGRLLHQKPGPRFAEQDAFVVATAQELGGRVLSLNPGLEGLEDIVPLG